VDDESTIIDSMKTILVNLGYTVDAFTDSTSVLAAFRDNPLRYDLLITDYTMPHLTGIDIAGVIKQIRHDIPVILCSGFVHKLVEEEARGAGISELLKKPVSRTDLANAIRRVLDRKQYTV
jgi:CheY-like chemotaxis protein